MRFVFLVLVLGCGSAAPSSNAAPSPPPEPAPSAEPSESASCPATCGGEAPATCSREKLAFTQADGCVNDGSVEFCLRAGDASEQATATILAIDPSIRCVTGSRGRAGCDGVPLCTMPLDEAACPVRHGKLSDAAWARLCNLSNLPWISRIVPTFYE